MKTKLIILIFILVFLLPLTQVSAREASSELPSNLADGYQIIALVNQVRAGYGLADLQAHSTLMAAAQSHSDYQASIGSITHSGAGGSNPVDRAMVAGYGAGAKIYVSENIYGGMNASPQQAVNWWVGDPPHLQTIVNPNATDAGAGAATGGKVTYYTLEVGYVSGSPGSGSASTPGGVIPQGGTPAPTAVPYNPLQTVTPAADGAIIHVVKPGQALWNIAAVYKLPIEELLALNGLTANSFIYPGDKILIRKGTGTLETVEVLTATAVFTGTLQVGEFTLVWGSPTASVIPPTISPASNKTQFVTPLPETEESGNPKGKIDPVWLAIACLFGVGTMLIVWGGLIHQRH